MCDVLEGGDSGPIFKVKRSPCSRLPIPSGSTVLSLPINEDNDGLISNVDYTSDDNISIQTILSDPRPPTESDILLCLERSDNVLIGDELGELTVEGNSPSLVWSSVSEKTIQACHKIYKRRKKLSFFCRHYGVGVTDQNYKQCFESLAKLRSIPGSVNIPVVIQTDSELELSLEILRKCWELDRFGLDVGFVQEMIEKLPGVDACSRYEFLNKRSCNSTPLTVGNGNLLVKTESQQGNNEEELDPKLEKCNPDQKQTVENPRVDDYFPPPGELLGVRLPPQLVGDVLEVWEVLCRFREMLVGLKEPLSFEELEVELISPWFGGLNLLEIPENRIQDDEDTSIRIRDIHASPYKFVQVETGAKNQATQARLAPFTYRRCNGMTLTKGHISLLKVLVSELQSKVINPSFDFGDLKSKRGKKKDQDSTTFGKTTKLDMLPINELTWPELARRYIIAFLCVDGNHESVDNISRESSKINRCLLGDGGVLCGSLTGVVAMEADSLLLADATKKIFGSLNRENDTLTIEDTESDNAVGGCESMVVDDGDEEGNVPEWARLLEPVRKLPTNVGARIRKCVHDALGKNPPDWAKEKLEHSISKEVYKGNASGPTKRAVISVLEDAYSKGKALKSNEEKKKKKSVQFSISDLIMKQCRIVLRHVAAEDKEKVFSTLLARNVLVDNNVDDGILGSPAMVSRPLDFRTIDLRLQMGAYGGSHEAFLEDVMELWNNIRAAYGDQPDLLELADVLSHNFETLYEKEVVSLFQKLMGSANSETLSGVTKKEIDDFLISTTDIPKAPWDEGVCKVCGFDKDDDSVLLCDGCDSEYHTYCLNPPLSRIPTGNWYCPSCVSMAQDATVSRQSMSRRAVEKCKGRHLFFEELTHLAAVMEKKEHWNFVVEERVFLLKFLCDELLNSTLIRQHLEQCAETSSDLQQKLRSLSTEWRNLKSREQILIAKALKADTSLSNCIEGPLGDLFKQMSVNHSEDISHNNNNIDSFRSRNEKPSDSQEHGNNILGRENSFPDNLQEKIGSNVSKNEPQTSNFELNSVKSDISKLQYSISCIESELAELPVRREFIGRDAVGRLYWILPKPGRHFWVLVDSTVAEIQLRKCFRQSGIEKSEYDDFPICSPWVSYQSEETIQELTEWLKDIKPEERALKECISHWQKLRYKGEAVLQSSYQGETKSRSSLSKFADNGKTLSSSSSVVTKAASLLQKKYGPCTEEDDNDLLKKKAKKIKTVTEEKMYRCDCLELILPSRQHCLSCHKTFPSDLTLEGHDDGKCTSVPLVSEKSLGNNKESNLAEALETGFPELGTRGQIKIQKEGLVCPYNFEKIRSTFLTTNSNRELVNEIGLIQSNGMPTFVPSGSVYLNDASLVPLPPSLKDEFNTAHNLCSIGSDGTDFGNAPKTCNANEIGEASKNDANASLVFECKDEKSSSSFGQEGQDSNCCVIPASSLKSLVGKDYEILRYLKINLLDMDTAIPEEALRPSKAQQEKRWAWRSFVKSAETIYEMVQATIVFEEMVKSHYLKNNRWYWSSLTAAAKTSTLSSLALRIYSLDDSIDYEKSLCGSDSTGKAKLMKKPNKRRKESE